MQALNAVSGQKKILGQNGLFPVRIAQRRLRYLTIVPRAKFTVFNPMLALGPMMVSSAVRDFCNVKIIDNNSHRRIYSTRELLEEIRSYAPDVLGVNTVVANAFWSYQFIRMVRQAFPGLPVLAGGLHAYHAAAEIASEGQPDIVVEGEGEIPVRKLFALLQEHLPVSVPFDRDLKTEIQQIPGLLIRQDNGAPIHTGPVELVENLDDLPFIDFYLSNIQDYIPDGKDVFGVTSLLPTQRGCPYKCSFCKADFMGGKIRNNSPEYVVQNVARLHEQFGLKDICFSDNNFTVPKARAIEICRLLGQTGLSKKISFRCWTNVLAPIDEEVLEALRVANFMSVQFGLERLTQEGMQAVDKIIDKDLVSKKLELFKKYGIKVFSNMLVGFPFETTQSVLDEKKTFLSNSDRIDGFQVWVVSPIPGTKLHRQLEAKKRWYLEDLFTRRQHAYFSIVFIDPMEAILQNLFNLSAQTIREIIRAKKELFLEYNYRVIKKWWLDPFFRLDIELGLLSRAFYLFSPALEHFLFYPFKRVRNYFQRRVVLKYYNSLKRQTT